MLLIFQAKLPSDITYQHHTHLWRNQLCENTLSSAPLSRHLALTNGSLGAVGVEECWYPRYWAVPVLTNHLRALPCFAWAPSESPGQEPLGSIIREPWPGARHSCCVASSWRSIWYLTGSSATQGYLSLGAKFICPVSVLCCSRGRGKWKVAPLEFHSYFLCLCPFVYLKHSFLDWLFCRSIRPVWERLLLCSPDSITHILFFSPFHLIPLFSSINQDTIISLQSFPPHCF